MKAKSKIVTSNQEGVHEELKAILSRMNPEVYHRPISDFSRNCYVELLKWIDTFEKHQRIILDMGCGVGESSFHLAKMFPDSLVIGIDKSEDRLARKSLFKAEIPRNLFLVRGELLDLWYLFATEKDFPRERLTGQYILYPNPWPKAKHVKRRWHGNAIAPYIFMLGSEIKLRTNWKIYAEEFLLAAKCFDYDGKLNQIEGLNPITPFERKYSLSDHDLYEVILQKKGVL